MSIRCRMWTFGIFNRIHLVLSFVSSLNIKWIKKRTKRIMINYRIVCAINMTNRFQFEAYINVNNRLVVTGFRLIIEGFKPAVTAHAYIPSHGVLAQTHETSRGGGTIKTVWVWKCHAFVTNVNCCVWDSE